MTEKSTTATLSKKMMKQNPKTKTTNMEKYKINEVLIQITSNIKKGKKTAPEATAKAKSAKEKKAWDKVSRSKRYQKAVARDLCQDVTAGVIEECLDGVCLNLSEENSLRSDAAQKRILRRIVEKRQAQATHRRVGRTANLFSAHLEKTCCSDCMIEINCHRFCA